MAWLNQILGFLAGLLVAAALLIGVGYLKDLQRLKDPHSIHEETGLTLPLDARIVEVESNAFSLADGANFTWHIESEVPFDTWIKQEGGHFEYTPASGPWDEAWKFVKKVGDREETSYLMIKKNSKVAALETFRP